MSIDARPRTFEEKVLYWAIVGTWLVWALGALYIAMPAMGWSLVLLIIGKRLGLIGDDDLEPLRFTAGSIVWICGMGIMAVAMIVGHAELDLLQLAKSFMGWMKGWALIAVFVVIGAVGCVRAEVIFRASNLLAVQTLFIAPIMLVAGVLHLPSLEFVSPLSVLGGSGPEYFTFKLYGVDLGQVRWLFFAPWSPAAGLIACVSLVLALYDRNRALRIAGIAATLVVCSMAFSRLAYVVIPTVCVLLLVVSNATRPIIYIITAAACIALLPFIDTLLATIEETREQFDNARAGSTRVRATLQSIALHRWWNEAPVFGHGTVERGPHLVAFMMIGTHHTWNGLLFVKGAVGFIALAVPMAWSVVEATIKAQSDRVARVALGVLLVLLLYSFGENLETLIYLFWPAMVVVGIMSRRRFRNPYVNYLGLERSVDERLAHDQRASGNAPR